VHEAVNAVNERILEEMGEPERGTGPAFRPLQPLPGAPDFEGPNAGDGFGAGGSRVHIGGDSGVTLTATRSFCVMIWF
jgi:hypothetical protein